MIRIAEEKDIPAILKLLEEVLYVHYTIRPDIFKEHGTKYTNVELKDLLNDKNHLIFVYEKDNKVVGHLFCEIKITKNSSNCCDLKTLYIDDLCIKKEYQHQGIGKKLMQYIEDYAKNNDYDNLTLNVWEGNDSAKYFYEMLNFKPQRTTMEKKIK